MTSTDPLHQTGFPKPFVPWLTEAAMAESRDWFLCTTLPSFGASASRVLPEGRAGNLKALRTVYRRVAEREPQMDDHDLDELRNDPEENDPRCDYLGATQDAVEEEMTGWFVEANPHLVSMRLKSSPAEA